MSTKTNKINFFEVKGLSFDVVGFMENVFISRYEINTYYEKSLKKCDDEIKSHNNAIKDYLTDGKNDLAVETLNSLENWEKQKKSILDEKTGKINELNNYSIPENFVNLKKGLSDIKKTGKEDYNKIIKSFFKSYGYDLKDTGVIYDIKKYCVSYDTSCKKLVNSDGKKILSLNVDRTYKNIVAFLWEKMVLVGAVKPFLISEVLKNKYRNDEKVIEKIEKHKNKAIEKTKEKLEKIAKESA